MQLDFIIFLQTLVFKFRLLPLQLSQWLSAAGEEDIRAELVAQKARVASQEKVRDGLKTMLENYQVRARLSASM